MAGYMFLTGTYQLDAGVQEACEQAAIAEDCAFIGPLTGPANKGRWWFVSNRPGLGHPFDQRIEQAVIDRLRKAGVLDKDGRPRAAKQTE